MQQLFRLLIFLIQPNMFRATNSPILRSTFWLYVQLLVQCTDTAADRCHGYLYKCIPFARLAFMNLMFVWPCITCTTM